MQPVSTITLRTVRPGLEREFEASLKEFFQRTRSIPGQLGVHVVRPAPGAEIREWGILRTFSNEEVKNEFFSSLLFLEWQAAAKHLMEGERSQQTLTGLETWFTLPGSKAIVPPPRWKMALLSTVGGTLSATAVSLALGPLMAPLGAFSRTLVMSVSIAALMTWLVMPALARLLKPLLYTSSEQ